MNALSREKLTVFHLDKSEIQSDASKSHLVDLKFGCRTSRLTLTFNRVVR